VEYTLVGYTAERWIDHIKFENALLHVAEWDDSRTRPQKVSTGRERRRVVSTKHPYTPSYTRCICQKGRRDRIVTIGRMVPMWARLSRPHSST
jgi:hypothetical protein